MTIHIGVAYATPERQIWKKFDVPKGSTLQEAIELSDILKQFPEIDLATQKVGVYGKVKPLNTQVSEGDRVEIYRAITPNQDAVSKQEKA